MEKVKFSAIEQLLKMASVHMPKFEQMIDGAGEELEELRKAAKQSAQTNCPVCHKRDKIIPYPPYGKNCTRCGTRMKLST